MNKISNSHKCPVPGCDFWILSPDVLLCLNHWHRISTQTQRRVWASWRALKDRPTRKRILVYRESIKQAMREAMMKEVTQ